MRILLARILLRLRGPIDCDVFVSGDWTLEGWVILVRCHRRYVTVWTLWYEQPWRLSIHRVPWRKVGEVVTRYGPED